MAILKFGFKWSFQDTAARFVQEFSQLSRFNWNEKSLNALLIIVAAIFALGWVFFPRVSKIINDDGMGLGQSPIPIMLIFLIFSLLCIALCRSRE
jgi:hypothetical protein|tara:strand:- start:834 stop:1118 length:285 start_codon:yes stop_codon:yes gene_type:complete